MGHFNDYEKARFKASHGMTTRLPRNASERLGQAAGDAERNQPLSARSNGGDSPTALGILVKLAFLACVLLVVIPGGPGTKAIPLGVGVLALFTIPLARFILRRLTPIYTGALLGGIVWAVKMISDQHSATAQSLAVYAAVGGVLGLLWVMVRWKHRT